MREDGRRLVESRSGGLYGAMSCRGSAEAVVCFIPTLGPIVHHAFQTATLHSMLWSGFLQAISRVMNEVEKRSGGF